MPPIKKKKKQVIPTFTPEVGECWRMKTPTLLPKDTPKEPTIDVYIAEKVDDGWKVETETGWTGFDRVYSREWFITPILNY
jgi:hypothetical protein